MVRVMVRAAVMVRVMVRATGMVRVMVRGCDDARDGDGAFKDGITQIEGLLLVYCPGRAD